jgi:predicted nucleic acid-binding protein
LPALDARFRGHDGGVSQGEAKCDSPEGRPVTYCVTVPSGPYDVLIAGQAVVRGMVLVSHNTREFVRVPGLQLEDWQ